jgi:hypothetical protein
MSYRIKLHERIFTTFTYFCNFCVIKEDVIANTTRNAEYTLKVDGWAKVNNRWYCNKCKHKVDMDEFSSSME